MNMWATPTTTPRYALMKEQLHKETWTPYTWSFANSKCGGGMWVPRSKFFSQFISCLGIGVCPRILLYKGGEREGLPWWQCWLHQQKWRCKYSQCPAFDIKQSPAGRSPEDHQVRTHAYLLLNKAQSCFHASFICSRMLWFECMLQHAFRGLLNQAWCLG